ncbi:hypothetical protein ABZZ17_04185 [Streptomyces sp. NPDC006512]|uniref:hypothetical protein n=1 Tax=Streptomyces sp. NPDC006512 TaxID=3154307 RepID=UPI0033B58D49
MKKRLVATALASAAIALGTALPASAGTTDTTGGTGTQNCISRSVSRSEGHGWAQTCDGRNVSGWIQDDKADGRCPYVIAYHHGGGETTGPRVGPKGKRIDFNFYANGNVSDFGIGYMTC